jgi:ABC-type lipoprotein release transport system permease subunit
MDISGNGQSKKLKGRIAGFSDRLNTILVPQSFIDYGNKVFGNGEQKSPSRIIIKTDDVTALETLMNKKGYETNREKIESGKQQSIAKNIMIVAMALGLLIVLLSLGTFLQFSDLLIARSDYEIKSLNYLGYNHAKITRLLFGQIIRFLLPGIIGALIFGMFIRWQIQKLMPVLFEKASMIPTSEAITLLVVLLLTYLGISYLNVYRQTRSLVRAY